MGATATLSSNVSADSFIATRNAYGINAFYTGNVNATSGSQNLFAISNIITQSSSTASATDLLINRTETSLGSGSQLFLDCQAGGTSKFSVDHTGFVKYNNSANCTTGSGTPVFGSNCPATTLTAPYKWIKMQTDDGSTVYVPAWK